MVEKCIRGGICHSIYRYAKTNNKYIKDFHKNKESSSFQYGDVNNLYGLFTMLQKWVEDTSQFNKDLIKNYNEESDKRCLLEVDVQYLKKFHELHDDLPFLPEQIKIEKVEKLIADLHVIPTRNLKHALNHGLILKEVHRVIKFNPNAWIKPYNDMNSDQRKKRKFFKVDK